MHFGSNDEINRYSTLDIDGDKDIVMFNKHEMDNKSRKNIASYLRDRISKQEYRFDKGTCESPDETFEVVLTDENLDWNNIETICIGDIEFRRKRFKNLYNNVKMFLVIKNGEDSYFMREGNRYLSREESCHVIDLIYNSGNITFSIDTDAWVKIQKG